MAEQKSFDNNFDAAGMPEQHLELVIVSEEQALKPLYLSCNLINSINSEAISACTESTGLISDNAD